MKEAAGGQRQAIVRLVPAGLVVALLCLVPLLGNYASSLMAEVLIFGIAAMGLDILMGYTGLVSFGHAAFFGVGAYVTVLLGVKLGVPAVIGTVAGVIAAAACAVVIGAFCVRASGVAFLMLTLAFAQLLYAIAMKWRGITGGSDGLGGLKRPDVMGWSLADPIPMYYVALASFIIVFLALRRLIASQLGHSFVGIRENEVRMRAMGYSTSALKLVSFTIAGAVAGVGGSLYALFSGYVSPDIVSWGTSGSLLLMTVLGGTGTLIGPAVGAAVFLLTRNVVSSHTEHWLLIVGLVFIACVMFFRQGVFGAAVAWLHGRRSSA
jgi:ABC-type branched-subunit amino acid transport system permease subunit